jgi:hypothetical protein
MNAAHEPRPRGPWISWLTGILRRRWRRVRFVGLLVVAVLCATFFVLGVFVWSDLEGAQELFMSGDAIFLAWYSFRPLLVYGLLTYALVPLLVHLLKRIPP